MKTIIKLYNKDCMEVMNTFNDKYFDLAVTDPPYGIKRDKGFGGFGKKIKRKEYKGNWDRETPKKECFDLITLKSNNQIIWGGAILCR